ncbi:unnamed protein product [Brassica oleracea]
MVSLCTTLKPLSPFSPFVKQGNLNYTSALITYRTSNSANSFLPKRGGTVAVHDAPDQVESSCRIPLTEVVAVRKKSAFWERSWSSRDAFCLPPSHHWGVHIALCYHRNLSHRSFDLPKWLEFIFAYGGILAFQGGPIEWVSNHRYHHKHCDTQRDPHSPTQGFWFGHFTWLFDSGSILKKCGGGECK